MSYIICVFIYVMYIYLYKIEDKFRLKNFHSCIHISIITSTLKYFSLCTYMINKFKSNFENELHLCTVLAKRRGPQL